MGYQIIPVLQEIFLQIGPYFISPVIFVIHFVNSLRFEQFHKLIAGDSLCTRGCFVRQRGLFFLEAEIPSNSFRQRAENMNQGMNLRGEPHSLGILQHGCREEIRIYFFLSIV
jgi:hypothetical protein